MEVICQILSVPCIVYFAYYLISGLFFMKHSKNNIKKHKASKKFAIIIAARNESKVIQNLIISLKRQRYPKELYEIFVAPNNCTDNTAEVSKNAGATIIDVNIITKNKGQVLQYVFDKLLYSEQHGKFDGYIIFDADNIVHPNFLIQMNNALCSGYQAAQGLRDSKNPGDSWISACHTLFCWGQNVLSNKSRMNMNLSAAITGTGFMVSHDLLFKIGYEPCTMSEDTELSMNCILNGERIAYVEQAVFYDEQCTSLKVSMKQRTRWSTGTYQCLEKYCIPLLKDAIVNRKYVSIDMLIYLIGPFMQAMGVLNLALLFLCNVLNLKVYTVMGILLCFDVVGMLNSYVVTVFLEMILVKVSKKRIMSVISGIILFPVFMFTWLPINIICIFKKCKVWEPIVHDRNVEIDTMLNTIKGEKIG